MNAVGNKKLLPPRDELIEDDNTAANDHVAWLLAPSQATPGGTTR